jgi:hypothetical protein
MAMTFDSESRHKFYERIAKKDKLSPEDVQQCLKFIGIMAEAYSDDEVAHAMEDALHARVLQDLSDTSETAHLALQSGKFRFARWCG